MSLLGSLKGVSRPLVLNVIYGLPSGSLWSFRYLRSWKSRSSTRRKTSITTKWATTRCFSTRRATSTSIISCYSSARIAWIISIKITIQTTSSIIIITMSISYIMREGSCRIISISWRSQHLCVMG